MIKAGTHTINDRGFAVSMEALGGVSRQALTLELPAGISDEALEAICAGPIEVLDEAGEVVQTHTGPFRVLSHGLKLTRSDAAGDVAALTARVSALETALTEAKSAKESAQSALASLSERFQTLQASIITTPIIKAEEAVTGDGESGV